MSIAINQSKGLYKSRVGMGQYNLYSRNAEGNSRYVLTRGCVMAKCRYGLLLMFLLFLPINKTTETPIGLDRLTAVVVNDGDYYIISTGRLFSFNNDVIICKYSGTLMKRTFIQFTKTLHGKQTFSWCS